MSKLTRICELLSTDDNQARVFCEQVQKFFKKVPSFKMIEAGLSQIPVEERTVESVIAWLQLAYPDFQLLSREKIMKNQQGPFIPKSLSKPSRIIHHASKGVGGFSDAFEEETISPILSHDPRKFLDGFEKCPHGIPKFSKCAICDPEGFRDKMGID